MMSSSGQCIVPNWNLRQQQRQEGEEEGEERNRSSHVQNLTHSYVVPMNNKDVMELTWHNGQLALNDLELNPPPPPIGDHTLESIVHQATAAANLNARPQPPPMPESSAGKWDSRNSGRMQAEQSAGKRVRRSEAEESACGSASAAFCRETDTTMMTWNSFESPRSLKCARVGDDDSLYQDGSENQEGGGTKGESCRSQSSARRSRAAAIHNLSERRRRDRINEKMKALQKLVPNASKTDKASMLDEVIEYLKQLQAQVHMMSNARSNMPQMVMPNLGMQQQLQMSLLARMGMGMGMNMGMGMLDVGNLARTNLPPTSFPPGLMHPANAPFVSPPPPFTMPPMVSHPGSLKASADASASAGASMSNFGDAYNTLLAQSMNMEFLNKMSAIYRQQSSQQPSKKSVNDAQGG